MSKDTCYVEMRNMGAIYASSVNFPVSHVSTRCRLSVISGESSPVIVTAQRSSDFLSH